MKHTKEEILNALKVIQEECEVAVSCIKCPFGGNSPCVFSCRSIPEEWVLADEEPETWRAFKTTQ